MNSGSLCDINLKNMLPIFVSNECPSKYIVKIDQEIGQSFGKVKLHEIKKTTNFEKIG